MQIFDEYNFQEIWCNLFHKSDHEHYTEESGDSGYGPYWEIGYRCKKCHRKWPDPEEVKRQDRAWRNDAARYYNCLFGTADEHIMTLHGEWKDPESLREAYDNLKELYLGGEFEAIKDIGPIEDKFFVFANDCRECHVDTGCWVGPYTDEWNLLNNHPGLTKPMHPEALKTWNARKLTYQQAIEKIQTTERDIRYDD